MLLRVSVGLCAVAACLTFSGCGDDNPLGLKAVSGKVTLDGAPLDHGSITFQPQGGAAPGGTAVVNSGTTIENGEYAIPAEQGLLPGTYSVVISAPDQSGAATSTDPNEAMRQASETTKTPPKDRVAAKYNTKTTLTATVTEEGDGVFNFDVTSN